MSKQSVRKAIILAAGLGNRISKVAANVPKPLLPLDGKPGGETFLDWHLRALSRANINEIYLVGNRRTFGTQLAAMREVPATWILNPTEDISTSGSGHSAHFAFESEHRILDGESGVILMDADVLYDPSIYGLLEGAQGSQTLVCSDYRHTDEEVLVFGDRARPEIPRLHGKGLLGTPLAEGCACLGEATGILYLAPEDHAAWKAVTAWTMRFSTAKLRSEHEDLTQRMMTIDRVRATGFGRELAFMECDTPDEYEVVVNEMYPRLSAMAVDRARR